MHLLLELDTTKMMQNLVERKFNSFKDGMIRDGIRFLALDKKEGAVVGYRKGRPEGEAI